MSEVSVLLVQLHGETIGTLTRVPGDRTLFAFGDAYVDDADRGTLSLSFKDAFGDLITAHRPTRTRLLPFFSNMLPEGRLRDYLAAKARVNPQREFFLLGVLGQDLPGAVTVVPSEGERWPPAGPRDVLDDQKAEEGSESAMRFSLAGVQLKFSALMQTTGGLTIPARGVGGTWIVKLPSGVYERVPENEMSMMTLARLVGIDVPELRLVDVQDVAGLPREVETMRGQALAVERFDRTDSGELVHVEDLAQVFGVYPEQKYDRASYRNIAGVLAAEGTDADVAEFIRRLVFVTLIGNADMHLKNWSLIYPDRRRAALAPAYDLVSTIQYLPDDNAALKYSRTKRMDQLTEDEFSSLAAKARLPQKLVLDTVEETVSTFHAVWSREKGHLHLSRSEIATIDAHIRTIPIAAS